MKTKNEVITLLMTQMSKKKRAVVPTSTVLPKNK